MRRAWDSSARSDMGPYCSAEDRVRQAEIGEHVGVCAVPTPRASRDVANSLKMPAPAAVEATWPPASAHATRDPLRLRTPASAQLRSIETPRPNGSSEHSTPWARY